MVMLPMPKDKTKKEHYGFLERIVYRDDDKPFCIIALTDGQTVTIGEHAGKFRRGSSVADKNWWYTAISRASKATIIVGDRTSFVNQCTRRTMDRRKTFLADMVKTDLQEGQEPN